MRIAKPSKHEGFDARRRDLPRERRALRKETHSSHGGRKAFSYARVCRAMNGAAGSALDSPWSGECCEASGSRAAAHMLRIRQFPAFMRAQIRCAVDSAAIVAFRAVVRDRDETHPRMVARLRMLDRRHGVVANLVAAVSKAYRAAGARNALKTRFD